MLFKQLYDFANGQPGPSVSVKALADFVSAHHDDIGEVHFYPVDIERNISLGHILYENDRSSAYGAEFRIASIRYAHDLNRCWRRFVICKELMHAFDTDEEKADTSEKFVQLLKDLENPPPQSQMSAMYTSEFDALWKALAVLCPATLREKLKADWEAKVLSDYDVALSFRIPESYVAAAMGPRMDAVLAELLAE